MTYASSGILVIVIRFFYMVEIKVDFKNEYLNKPFKNTMVYINKKVIIYLILNKVVGKQGALNKQKNIYIQIFSSSF